MLTLHILLYPGRHRCFFLTGDQAALSTTPAQDARGVGYSGEGHNHCCWCMHACIQPSNKLLPVWGGLLLYRYRIVSLGLSTWTCLWANCGAASAR